MSDLKRNLQTIVAARTDGDPEEAQQLLRRIEERIEWRRRRGFKVCARCKEAKKPDEFGIDAREPDGLLRICRPCVSARDKARYRATRENPS